MTRSSESGKRRGAGMIGAACIGGLIVAAAWGFAAPKQAGHAQGDSPVVATVNEAPIAVKELTRQMSFLRTGTLLYFQNKYGVSDEPDFWESSYGGENPLRRLKDKAMEAAARIKVEQMLARDEGVVQDIAYSAFEADFMEENARRRRALENKEVIYGPEQYSEDAYFHYVYSNMVIALKERLQGDEIPATDGQLRDYYEATREERYRIDGDILINKIYVSYVDGDGAIDEAKKREAEKKIAEAKARLDRGENFNVLAEEYNESDSDRKSHGEQLLGNSMGREEQRYFDKLMQAAAMLRVGETSDVIEANNAFFILRCMDKTDSSYASFSEVKSTVQLDYVNMKYEEMIDELAKAADLEIDPEVYAAIRMNE